MRVFVAVPLDEETRHRLARVVLDGLPGLPGRPVAPESWHFTLRFLGEIDEVALDRIRERLDASDLGAAFDLSFSGVGAFPNPSKASVVWLGVDRGAREMSALAGVADAALVDAGFPPEDRLPFRPHLTLSRLRPQQDVREAISGGFDPAMGMRVDRVAVFESHLGEGPARYSKLDEFLLAD